MCQGISHLCRTPLPAPCPVRQTLYAIHSPPLDPQHSVLVKYSSLIFFKTPICSSSPQGHRVILLFNRGEQSFFSYQTICFSQQAFIRKSRIETPLPEKNPIILFCKFPVNLKSISYNSISILMIYVLYFIIQLKSPGSHTLIYWT